MVTGSMDGNRLTTGSGAITPSGSRARDRLQARPLTRRAGVTKPAAERPRQAPVQNKDAEDPPASASVNYVSTGSFSPKVSSSTRSDQDQLAEAERNWAAQLRNVRRGGRGRGRGRGRH